MLLVWRCQILAPDLSCNEWIVTFLSLLPSDLVLDFDSLSMVLQLSQQFPGLGFPKGSGVPLPGSDCCLREEVVVHFRE